MKKVLVTGAAGFIGNELCLKLLEKDNNFQIIGIDNLNDYYDVALKGSRLKRLENSENFNFYQEDIANKEVIEKIFTEHKPEIVINLAAQAGVRYSLENPHAYVQSNVIGFMNILEACRYNDVKHLVYASSSSVYGANEEMPFSTTHSTEHPLTIYAATKKANEMMAHSYSNLYNLPTTGLRFFTVYGPWGRPDMAPFLFTDAIMNDREIKVFNNGEMSRDFTYIDDIVRGIIGVMSKTAKVDGEWDVKKPNPSTSGKGPYKIYNIGRNEPTNLLQFIELIEKHTGKKAKKKFMPMQDGDVENTWADSSELINDVKMSSYSFTSIDDGVKSFVDWYKGYFKV